MIDHAIGHTLPIAWWLWWFALGVVIYGILGVWFWKSFHRHDRPIDENHPAAPANGH